MILTGSIINQRKSWGNKYIERLANDLKEFGNGYSKRNLIYMGKLANSLVHYSRDYDQVKLS